MIDKNKTIRFEVGKYYQHSTSEVIHIIGEVTTFFYGSSLLAERSDGVLVQVGSDHDSATGYHQVSGWPRSTYAGNNIPEPHEGGHRYPSSEAVMPQVESFGMLRATAEGWTDIHGGDTGAYWRGINPVTRRVEKLPKRYTDHI